MKGVHETGKAAEGVRTFNVLRNTVLRIVFPLNDIWRKLKILQTKKIKKFIDKERHLAVLKTLRTTA